MKKIDKKTIRHIVIIAILILFTIFFSCIVYVRCIKYANLVINPGDALDTVQLKQNDTIIQRSTTETGKIKSEAYLLTTGDNGEKELSHPCVLEVKLYNEADNSLLATAETEITGKKSGGYVTFEFDNVISVTTDYKLKSELSVKKLDANDELYINIADDSNTSAAEINGIPAKGGVTVVYQITRMDYYSMAAIAVALISGLFIIAMYVLLFVYKKLKIEYIYLIAAIVLGIIYFILIPEGQTPDEFVHIETAYDVANVAFGYKHGSDIEMRKCDIDENVLSSDYRRGTYNEYVDQLLHDHSVTSKETQWLGDTPLNTNRYLYYVSAFGMIIGRLLKWGTVPTYFLGAMFNYIVFVAVTFYAIKKIPFGKTMVLLFGILPMTMQQVTSYSYDCGILTLSVLMVAIALRVAYADDVKIKDLVILGITTLLLASVKNGAYYFMVFLNIIPLVRFRKNNKVYFRVIIGIIAAGTLTLLGPIIRNAISSANGGTLMNGYVGWADEPGYTVSYVLHNPVVLIEVCWNTFINSFEYYIYTMFGGSLGWLNISISWWIVIVLMGTLLVSAMKKQDEETDIKPWTKWLFAIISVYSIGCTAAAMLLDWTPLSYNHILGIQGRYFLPILMLLILIMRGNWIKIGNRTEAYCIFTTVMIQPFIFYSLLEHMLF